MTEQNHTTLDLAKKPKLNRYKNFDAKWTKMIGEGKFAYKEALILLVRSK